TLLAGGTQLQDKEYEDGYFYSPTILSDINEKMKVVHEETFGPVIPLIPFTSEVEVIQKANHAKYGLVAYFYTNDLSQMHRVSEALEYGIVGVNDHAPFTVQAPFG